MNETRKQSRLEAASVTDRGLNEKRPHNEDSFLLDAERCIFAVADGVGGANAGEVASQTAVEILDEAFRQHRPGEDAEDLMELAIQRANASIHQMAREQKHLASMATTIVALHLDGNRATVAHVGDSRLYRLEPRGRLQRETEDHSVVEEEVRAGRMTPEQAANHPSRNVINRALGAEPTVEVDLKTFEVEEGTIFLLCSDGITRHLSDEEIGELLRSGETLEDACAAMKRRCFERGAEDNLTAVAVRIGARALTPASAPATEPEDERTLTLTRPAVAAAGALSASSEAAGVKKTSDGPLPVDGAGAKRSRVSGELRDPEPAQACAPESGRSPVGRAGHWMGTLLLLIIVGAAAFYGGKRYELSRAEQVTRIAPVLATTPDGGGYELYERMRGRVDASPAAEAERMAGEQGGRPLDSFDPVFLSLYGRALLLSGRNADALQALRLAAQKLGTAQNSGRDPVAVDTRLAFSAAALRANDPVAAQEASQVLSVVIEANPAAGGAPVVPVASPTGAASPGAAASPTSAATPQQSPMPLR